MRRSFASIAGGIAGLLLSLAASEAQVRNAIPLGGLRPPNGATLARPFAPPPAGRGMQVGAVTLAPGCARTGFGVDCGGGFLRAPAHNGQTGSVGFRPGCVRRGAAVFC